MMHIWPFCARKGAIPGETITAAIPIGLRAAVKTRLSAVRTFNALRSTSNRMSANARRLVSRSRVQAKLTIQSAVTFNSDAIYIYTFKGKDGQGDRQRCQHQQQRQHQLAVKPKAPLRKASFKASHEGNDGNDLTLMVLR